MAGIPDLYFPSPDARELNRRLLEEHLAFLEEEPEWVPAELRRIPKSVARFLNRLAPRMPLTAPLGWIDGKTPADDHERDRIAALPEGSQTDEGDLHERAIYGRCFRIGKPLFTVPKTPAPPDEASGD
ncbi:MAG: hypothetical protein VX833_04700 [Actinomycetota bacterium]|nr:hypothetical protein [Actinomycetota bacterium]